ncbi:DNA replication and repair protein RecF [Halobacteriovorax vibrionivorans]|uniref:DNA replication and repair protein RecF n=1 Tax=Halobacteriovorax vibrionivorans TaxID=2152716 RepID=A0ABY0IME6_9BACT|nr:DNA replication and repair protein RecF [Halobacteriovorax vibrionivorans]TGD49313.1 DNA replication and repair protein RecF [Halobacteriovorax sp. Y22]
MILKLSKLQITNFRNLQPDIISFNKNINCILGENGNGKTNILEALHVLVTRKSFRKNTTFPQLLSIDGDNPEILFSSLFENEGDQITFTGKMNPNGSSWTLNGKNTKKKLDAKLVFINPFDSYSFSNIPSFRRKWFDDHLSLLSRDYKKVLNQYNSSLRFRNVLLSKKPPQFREQLQVIDRQMADYAYELVAMRNQFVAELIPYCEKTYRDIFSEEHELNIQVDSRFHGFSPDMIFDYMQQRLEKDLVVGHTTYQVHKDDYVLLFDGMNAYEFCSLGQQKMSYLSLIFAYIELFRYNLYTYPIVLIDDVSGELDKARWGRLVNFLEQREFQVLITTANEKFKEELEKIDGANKIYISNGSIH